MLHDVLEAIRVRQPWLMAIAGIPGAGKTTLANAICERIPGAIALPMDGYHLPRALLNADQMERRGAPDTFDPDSLRADLQSLREKRSGVFPTFDHAAKDPRANAIVVPVDAPLVIVEGLYLLLQSWRMADLFDFTLFLDCDREIATNRLAARHLACGLATTPEAARQRAVNNDGRNAELILADGCRERADLVVHSADIDIP